MKRAAVCVLFIYPQNGSRRRRLLNFITKSDISTAHILHIYELLILVFYIFTYPFYISKRARALSSISFIPAQIQLTISKYIWSFLTRLFTLLTILFDRQRRTCAAAASLFGRGVSTRVCRRSLCVCVCATMRVAFYVCVCVCEFVHQSKSMEQTIYIYTHDIWIKIVVWWGWMAHAMRVFDTRSSIHPVERRSHTR